MPLFSETEDKIFGDIMTDVLGRTNLSRSSAGSKMRTLIESVSKKMGRMWSQFDLNMIQAFVDGAEGKFLNYIGDLLQVPRLGEEPASISSSDRNVKFYVEVGTFGDLNNGNSILIPKGKIIGTREAGTGISYRTVIDTVLAASTNEAYIAVQSVRSGSSVNVGKGTLIYHNFTDYADSVNDTLKVTNDAEIIKGQDIENETNYRFRITNQVLSLERANRTAIRLAALAVPGVADIVSLPYHRGIGTYDLMIKSTVPSISSSLIANVQEAIGNVTSHGIYATARGPREVGVSMVGSLILKNRVSAKEQTDIITAATDNVTYYINNLDIGEDFVINEVVERVMSTSDVIKTLGVPNKPLDSLFSYTPSKLEDNKIRASLLADLDPSEDERIIVENRYAGNTPILFRIVA